MSARKGIHLFEPFSERRLLNQGRYRSVWRPPYALQRKLNGERCRALNFGGRCLLLSSTEEILASAPHINQYFIRHFPDGEYDGEIYVHGWTLGKIHSVLWTTSGLHPEHESLQFHMFDVKNKDNQAERLSTLQDLPHGGPIVKVSTDIVFTLDEIMTKYDQYIGEGYEGFIIRELSSPYKDGRSQLGMKFKPKKKDSYKIVGINEAIDKYGKPKGMVGSFICEDDMGTRFDPGAGKMTHLRRKEIFEMFKDDPSLVLNHMLEIEYQCMSDRVNVPHFSRAVEMF